MFARMVADKRGVDDLTKDFVAESLEGLDRMEQCLAELERRPDDAELVAEIFRAVHTIKGGTGFLGFGRLEALAHVGESLLCALRAGHIQVTAALIDGLLALLDGLRSILDLIVITGGEGQRSSDDDFELTAQLMSLNLSERVATVVPVARDADEGVAVGEQRGHVQAPSRTGGLAEQERRDGMDPQDHAETLVGRFDAAESRVARHSGEKTLRVDVDVLNRMMNLVGELVLTRNAILQSACGTESFGELGRRLDAVTSDLRETVMRARMQPLGQLFAKFPRMVRDLSVICGRRVRIEFDGEETGLDKGLLESIRDPLTHAIRNAVDHGIEPPEVRVAAGKPAEGLLRLSACHQNGAVVIELSDDGAGIAVDRVLRKAVERGLVTAEQAARMCDRDALRLIFAAGFSMASEVTTVSGRGVGMDVIRENLERVGGTVEVESQVGLGTTVRMRVPLTLAIVPALIVRSSGRSFALPQGALLELVYVHEQEMACAIHRIGNAELYRLRERLIPLLRLSRLLQMEDTTQRRGMTIAFVEVNGCRYGLVVDELVAPEEIVVKSLSSALRLSGLFAGATMLGNGTLALILDVAAIGKRHGVSAVVRSAWTEPAPAGELAGKQLQATQPLMVYEVERATRQGSQVEKVALPLTAVERIESFERKQIEFAGGRPMLRYRQELLAVRDDGDVLGRCGGAQVTVLICSSTRADEGRLAVVVERVLEVCAGACVSDVRGSRGGQVGLVNDAVMLIGNGQDAGLQQDWLQEAV